MFGLKLTFSRVEKKVSNDNILKGKRALANQVLLDADKYIPKKDGVLRASGQIAIDGSNVSWNTVYARAQYYGTNGIVTFNHYTTQVLANYGMTQLKRLIQISGNV